MPKNNIETWCSNEHENCFVTQHAVERWLERIGRTKRSENARHLIQNASAHAIQIPNRLATKQWVLHAIDRATTDRRRIGIRYAYTGTAVLVTAGQGRVLTILKPNPEDFATVITWLLTGHWLDKS